MTHSPSTEPPDFELLYRAHVDAVRRYVVRRAPMDVDDVVAETFVIAWRKFDSRPARFERPWLLAIARRVAANAIRAHSRRAALLRRLDAAPTMPDHSDERETEQIAAAFNGLSASDREVLALVAWEQLAPIEVAVALGISQVAARVRISRARRRFSEALAPLGPGALPTPNMQPRRVP